MKSEAMKGLAQLDRRLTDPDWIEKPAGELLRRWLETVKTGAIKRAPSWKGTLKRGIEGERDSARFPLWARVFVRPDVPEAGPMEWGTGKFSEAPGASHRPHWPPAKALAPWAADHGLNPYAVARAIGKRGGLKPQRYFRDAEKDADAKLDGWMQQFARGIERGAQQAAR